MNYLLYFFPQTGTDYITIYSSNFQIIYGLIMYNLTKSNKFNSNGILNFIYLYVCSYGSQNMQIAIYIFCLFLALSDVILIYYQI